MFQVVLNIFQIVQKKLKFMMDTTDKSYDTECVQNMLVVSEFKI